MLVFAVTSKGASSDNIIPELFENTEYVLFYDTDTGRLLDTIARNGQSDKQLAEVIADKKAEAVICGPLNRDAYDVIASDDNSITRYNGVGLTVKDALDAALNYKLDIIRDPIDGVGCIGSKF